MLVELIKYFENRKETPSREMEGIDGQVRVYTDRQVFPLPYPATSTPAELVVGTLGAFVDYLEANVDDLDFSKLLVHVESHSRVALVGSLDFPHGNRAEYLVAKRVAGIPTIIGNYVSTEEARIQIRGSFNGSEDANILWKVLSEVVHEKSELHEDLDGEQVVTKRQGAKTRTEKPDTVSLAPFRTFSEVAQPVSYFVPRWRPAQEGQQSMTLIETDNGAWKVEAAKRIRDHLKEDLESRDLKIAILA